MNIGDSCLLAKMRSCWISFPPTSEGVDFCAGMGDFPQVKQVVKQIAEIRIGSQCRAYLNGFVKEGERYQVDKTGEDEIRLRRMVVKEEFGPAVQLIRRGGHTILKGDRVVTLDDMRKALEEFP